MSDFVFNPDAVVTVSEVPTIARSSKYDNLYEWVEGLPVDGDWHGIPCENRQQANNLKQNLTNHTGWDFTIKCSVRNESEGSVLYIQKVA